MDIRLATHDDLPEIARALVAASDEMEHKYGTARMDVTIMQAIEHGVATDQAVIVAFEGSVLVGWCAWVILPGGPNGCAHGLGTWVRPGCRELGISKKLRTLAAAKAKSCGATHVVGTVDEGNAAGLRSSLAEGFDVIGTVVRKAL